MATRPVGLAGRNTYRKINVDFYRVEALAGGPDSFYDAFSEAGTRRGEGRCVTVRGEDILLHTLHNPERDILEGELSRLRMTETPSIASRGGAVSEIQMRDDEGVAERTAFLFHRASNVLAFHVLREAVGASKIAGYADTFNQNRLEEQFELAPILRADAQARFQRMQVIRKVEIKYAEPAHRAARDADESTGRFLRAARGLEAHNMEITVSAGRPRSQGLNQDAASSLVRGSIRNSENLVRQLRVTGKGAGDEHLIVDLIEDRLREQVTVGFQGRSPSYATRIRAVREAFERNGNSF